MNIAVISILFGALNSTDRQTGASAVVVADHFLIVREEVEIPYVGWIFRAERGGAVEAVFTKEVRIRVLVVACGRQEYAVAVGSSETATIDAIESSPFSPGIVQKLLPQMAQREA